MCEQSQLAEVPAPRPVLGSDSRGGSASRVELAALAVLALAWIGAMLAVPAVVWMQVLDVAHPWMRRALFVGVLVPITLVVAYLFWRGLGSHRRR